MITKTRQVKDGVVWQDDTGMYHQIQKKQMNLINIKRHRCLKNMQYHNKKECLQGFEVIE